MSTSSQVRKVADIWPSIFERSMQYTNESKWEKIEKITPELARLWVQQMSLWTRTTFKSRGHTYALCPYPEVRRALYEVVSEEDIVDPRVGMNHRQLMVTSMGKATGQTLADLEKVKPLPTTLLTFEIFYGVAMRGWEEGLGLSAGHERFLQESGWFSRQAKRFKRDLGLSDADLGWFTGHDAADEDHGSIINLLDKYVTDDRVWDRVEEATIQATLAWNMMMDGIVDAYKQKIAPVNGTGCRPLSTVF